MRWLVVIALFAGIGVLARGQNAVQLCDDMKTFLKLPGDAAIAQGLLSGEKGRRWEDRVWQLIRVAATNGFTLTSQEVDGVRRCIFRVQYAERLIEARSIIQSSPSNWVASVAEEYVRSAIPRLGLRVRDDAERSRLRACMDDAASFDFETRSAIARALYETFSDSKAKAFLLADAVPPAYQSSVVRGRGFRLVYQKETNVQARAMLEKMFKDSSADPKSLDEIALGFPDGDVSVIREWKSRRGLR